MNTKLFKCITSNPKREKFLWHSAEAGNAEAAYELGILYIEHNMKERGLEYLKKAALKDYSIARESLKGLFDIDVITKKISYYQELTIEFRIIKINGYVINKKESDEERIFRITHINNMYSVFKGIGIDDDIRKFKTTIEDDIIVNIIMDKKNTIVDNFANTFDDEFFAKLKLNLSADEKSAFIEKMVQAFSEAIPVVKGSINETATLTLPQTWEEAKAQVPGLMKWSEAKAANSQLTIIDHMRDTHYGYGRWARVKPGLPRNLLNKWDDHAAYHALYAWLKENKTLPDDLYLPRRSEVVRQTAELTPEAVKEARRISSLWQRPPTGKRGQQK